MKFKKYFYIFGCFFVFVAVSNCVQTTAPFFGSAITVAKTGNVYQAGISYASNTVIKDTFGTTPGEYIGNLLVKEQDNNGLISAKTKKLKQKKIKSVKSSEDNMKDYSDFITAVKKILK